MYVAGWQKANPDKVRACSERFARAHPEKIREATGRWREKNPDHIRAYEARYRAENADRVKEKNAAWWRAHPEEVRAYLSTRRTRKAQAGGKHGAADLRAQYAAQRGLCYYCETPLNGVFHADHKTPVSRGGTSWPENMCCACPACNLRKRALTEDEFRARMTARVA